jgi:hypothetical protein
MLRDAIHLEPVFTAVLASQRKTTLLGDQSPGLAAMAAPRWEIWHQVAPYRTKQPLQILSLSYFVAAHKTLSSICNNPHGATVAARVADLERGRDRKADQATDLRFDIAAPA